MPDSTDGPEMLLYIKKSRLICLVKKNDFMSVGKKSIKRQSFKRNLFIVMKIFYIQDVLRILIHICIFKKSELICLENKMYLYEKEFKGQLLKKLLFHSYQEISNFY